MGLDRSSLAQEKRSADRAATDPSRIRASGGSLFEAKNRPGDEFLSKILELLAIYEDGDIGVIERPARGLFKPRINGRARGSGG
jgi:hypothetical protein